MSRGVGVAALLVAVLCGGCAGRRTPSCPTPDTAPCAPRRIHFSADAGLMIGPASGSVQIPRGGSALTSSHGRPTLDELGVDVVAGPSVSAGVSFGPHALVAEAARLDLSGQNTLQEDLVSHGRFFAAGEELRSDSAISRLRLTYRRSWNVPVKSGSLVIAGAVGCAVLNMDSQLSGDSRFTETRNFTHGEPSLGVHALWRPSGLPEGLTVFFDGDTTFGTFVPIGVRHAGVHELRAGVSFRPSRRFRLNASVGAQLWELLDSQGFPNHVSVQVVPVVLLSGTIDI